MLVKKIIKMSKNVVYILVIYEEGAAKRENWKNI